MADDRLWQMDRMRHRALDRQEETLGPAYVAADLAYLTVADLSPSRAASVSRSMAASTA